MYSFLNQTPRKGDKHSRKRKTLIDIRPNVQDYIIKQYKEKSKKKRSTKFDMLFRHIKILILLKYLELFSLPKR